MSAAPAEAAVSTTKAVVARKFHHRIPLSDVHQVRPAAALMLPRQQPTRLRSDDAPCVLAMSLVRRAQIGCDPLATVTGKRDSRCTRVWGQSAFFAALPGYAAAAPCHFTAAVVRRACCPNAPAKAQP